MSSASFLSSSWPPSCLQRLSRPSGVSTFDLSCFPASLMVIRRNHRPSPCLFPPSCGVLSKLRRMEPGATATPYGQLLDCVCSWGQAADVIELITDWLAEALPKRGVSLAETLTSGVEAERIHVFFFCPTAGEREQRPEGAYPGDGGGQTGAGSGLPGVPV